MVSSAYELTVVPRGAVRFPLAIPVPDGFDVARRGSWPEMPGRLEYVGGSLLFRPPCGDSQQKTAVDLLTELNVWRRSHREFVVGGNEAGMLLGGEVRGADAAVWRAAELGEDTGGFPRVAPVLVAEIAGKDETIDALAEKARWYLDHGVLVVWILDPATRTGRVLTGGGAVEVARGAVLPAHTALPDLSVSLGAVFQQLAP